MAYFEFTHHGETARKKDLSGWGCFGIAAAFLAVFAFALGIHIAIGYGLGYIVHLLVTNQIDGDVNFWPFWALGTLLSMMFFSIINRSNRKND